ncbi:MAG: HDOD domain-containing protein [Planctomycetota bacterium]
MGRGAAESGASRQVELILEQVDSLPTLSPVALQVLTLGSADEVEIDEVVRLLESDPALTTTILGLCRKADKGLGDRIDTVKRAVVMLGMDAVRSAVLSVHVYEMLRERGEANDSEGRTPDPASGEPRFDRVGLWKHSVAVACASELLAKRHPHLGVQPDEAFVAGLLHDLGKLVLELVLPRAMGRVAELAERRGSDASPIERSIVGLDHHTAGRRVAARWRLPVALQDVMWLHSQPYRSLPDLPHRPLIGLVTLAKSFCRRQHIGWSGDYGEPMPTASVCSDLGVDPTTLDPMLPDLITDVVDRSKLLHLDEQTDTQLLLQSIAAANKRLSALNSQLRARAQSVRQQTTVLETISGFHAAWQPRRGVAETLEEVVRNAQDLLGVGFYAAVFQDDADELWRIYRFGSSGSVVRSEATEPPPGQRLRGESLANLAEMDGMSVATMGVLPWLSDYLGDAADLRRVRMIPLGPPGEGHGSSYADGPWALLLHDRDPERLGFNRSQMAAVRTAWAAAVQAAAAHEHGERLGERIAETNRSLAEVQQQLTDRESMARLGEMSAGAAHEMNNPLTVIRGRSQLLVSRLSDEGDKAAAKSIAEASAHLADLIESMHLLASPPTPEIERVSLAVVFADAIERAQHRAGVTTPVGVELGEGGAFCELDRELAVCAVTEVVANALEACPGGPVRMGTHVDALDGRLVVTVEDHGSGLSEKAQKHAFDPFFSEKPAGRQPGLGLARARQAVELHGGEIAVESPRGEGTRVSITLPAPTDGGEDVAPGPGGEAPEPIERRVA